MTDLTRAIKGWPADAVERRPIAKLVRYARNARTHSPEQLDQIAASIRESAESPCNKPEFLESPAS